MQKLRILNSKEAKKIYSFIEQQWGCDVDLEYTFLQNERNKIYVINKKFGEIDVKKLRINSVGLQFGEETEHGLRLSIEGSQLIGKFAKKNILELSLEQLKEWMAGSDLENTFGFSGFILIRYKGDFIGTGKAVGNKIYNYVSKIRRVNLAVLG